MGRRTELNDIVAQKVVKLLRDGLSRPAASQRLGYHKNTLHEWIVKGESGQEYYAGYAGRFIAAEAEFTERMHGIVLESATRAQNPSIENAKWLLERRRPEDYSAKRELEATLSASELDEAREEDIIKALEGKGWKKTGTGE